MFRNFAQVVLLLALLLMASLSAVADSPLLPVGSAAPNFTALGWSGKNLLLSDYRGQIVVLDFWASWCHPCNLAMPHLQHVHSQFKDDGVTVLGLCVSDTRTAANTWIKAHPEYTFTFAFDPVDEGQDSISLPYQVTGIPTTYIIDKKGMIAADGVDMSEDDIIAALKRLGATSAADKAYLRSMMDKSANDLNPGEIKLHGTITSHKGAEVSLVLSATSITFSTGETHPFDKPRSKNVVLSPTTFIIRGDTSVIIDELKPGIEVEVTGKDTGVGKDLPARRVKIINGTHTAGP